MRYLFTEWDTLIDEIDLTKAERLAGQLIAGIPGLRQEFLDVLCSSSPEEIIIRQVRTHQRALLTMAGRLEMTEGSNAEQPKTKTPTDPRLPSLGLLFDALEPLLEDHWDQDQEIPAFRRHQLRQIVFGRLEELSARLKAGGVDKELIRLLIALKAGIIGEGKPFTYRQWRLVTMLVSGVDGLPVGPGAQNTERIIDLVLAEQLHYAPLFTWLKEKVETRILKMEDPAEQVTWLQGELGRVGDMVNQQHPGATPEMGSVSALYAGWLEVTIAQIRSRAQESVDGLLDEKIETTLSMAELGLFLRLFLDTKVFKNENIMAVARFMTVMVKTRGSKPRKANSARYLYQLIYNVPPPTFTSFRKIMGDMGAKLAELEREALQPKPLKKASINRKRGGKSNVHPA